MNIRQFTALSERIFDDATAKLPSALQSGLVHDKSATVDSERVTHTLKFCIWKDSPSKFWNRHYSSYHIIYDPQKELSEDCLLQVRYMFFLDRKEVGKGAFNNAVFQTLQPLGQQHGFECYIDPKLAVLRKRYEVAAADAAWEADATKSLAWLLTNTLPTFSKL